MNNWTPKKLLAIIPAAAPMAIYLVFGFEWAVLMGLYLIIHRLAYEDM